MVLAVPFILVYIFNNKKIREFLVKYSSSFILSLLAFSVPVIFSSSAVNMVLKTEEAGKIYDISLRMREGLTIYLLPMIYLIILYFAWRVRRISFELLVMLMAIGFFAVILMTPASPGWFLWICPFLVMHQMESGNRAIVLVSIFSLLFVVFELVNSTGAIIPVLDLDFKTSLQDKLAISSRQVSILLTMLISFGVMLCYRLIESGIINNDYYRLSRKPLFIGISGDSGSGKDTFANSLMEVFGKKSVVHISGDDYHIWDRNKPMWQILTHLNPKANYLEQFNNDAISLSQGKAIRARHYDHSNGKMTKPRRVKNNDIVIASGLHALFGRNVSDKYDVKIFLDMDNNLRKLLKIRRDTIKRGHSLQKVLESIEAREADRQKFIQPQKENADLIFKVEPLKPLSDKDLNTEAQMPKTKLKVSIGKEAVNEKLIRCFVSLCNAHIDVSELVNKNEITIDGDFTAEDVAIIAGKVIENLEDIAALEPKWESGILGVMQLFALSLITMQLRKRLL